MSDHHHHHSTAVHGPRHRLSLARLGVLPRLGLAAALVALIWAAIWPLVG